MKTLWLNRILLVLGAAGIFVAGFLTYTYANHLSIPCGTSNGCDALANNPASKWFGISVPVYGLVGYSILFVLATIRTVVDPKIGSKLVTAGLIVSGLGMGASFILMNTLYNQLYLTCEWCLTSAILMSLTFILYGVLASFEWDANGKSKIDPLVALSLFVVAVGMIGMRVNGLVPNKMVSISNFSIDSLKIPEYRMLGPKGAKVVVLEVGDFFCGLCRTQAGTLEEIQGRYPGVRVGFMHLPLYMKEGHEASLAVAEASELAGERGRFWDFFHLMMSPAGEEVKSQEAIIELAMQVGVPRNVSEIALTTADDPSSDEVINSVTAVRKMNIDQTPSYVFWAEGKGAAIVDKANLDKLLQRPDIQALLNEAPSGG